MMIGTKQWFVVILGCFTLVHSLSVRVCQNKHCVKRNPNILQTISNLIDVPIESSGCLSHCESGPNVEIHLPGGGSSKVMEGLTDATTVAIQLELHLNFPIPKLLLAASKVMERATQTRDLSEQERLLSSVINKLEGSTEHNPSTALAHAYALRAKTSFEDLKYPLAIEDSQKAIDCSNIATSATLSMAYRVWADAEQACGSGEAIAVLQRWHRAQPTYRTKLQKEIQDLRESNST